MNKYAVVPLANELDPLPPYAFRSGQGWNQGHRYMGKYIEDAMLEEMGRIRKNTPRKELLPFYFSTEIMPDSLIEGLREETKPAHDFDKVQGRFSVSEVNELIRNKYASDVYKLAQAKNRAIENQNAINSILGQVQGYSPNNITERILMSVMAGE